MIAKALGKAALKWLLIALAFILLLSAINYGLGFIPFTPQWSGKRAVAKVSELTATVDTLNRQAAGQAEITRAVDTYHTREIVIRDDTAQTINEAHNDPNADAPLSAGRLGSLSRHEQRMCVSAALSCSTIDPSRRGAGAVSPDGPAGERDAG